MIGSPDVVAFTKDDDFRDSYTDTCLLPEEFSVPSLSYSHINPWTKTSYAKFFKDFILISEFSEQVGPQPLLTIPDDSKVCGTFDLNYFSLRIMSVDYQASFVGHPPGTSYPKLSFVEDSIVVLGDSKEGAFAYVHHLTLYDLEARGFVRPFCMAYISADENKIMQQFQQLSSGFSKASECLKSGNRKAFAKEVEKKLKDLEYTRSVLHKETELQKTKSGCYSTQVIEKANELANVEKSIYEHKDLLRQITSYPRKKRQDSDHVQCELESMADTSTADQTISSNHSECKDNHEDTEDKAGPPASYTPQLIKAKSAKCFDKRLKTLEELCDSVFYLQTIEQLNLIEKTFKGDLCCLYTSQINQALLSEMKITSFLFEEERDFEEAGTSRNLYEQIHTTCSVSPPNLSAEPLSLESYTTCIEMSHDKLEFESLEVPAESSTSDITQETSEEANDSEAKWSFSSDRSVETLGNVSPANPDSSVKKCAVNSSKELDDIPFIATVNKTLLLECEVDFNPAGVFEPGNLVQIDTGCCMRQDGFIHDEHLSEPAQECCEDTVVEQEPLSLLQGDPALQVDYVNSLLTVSSTSVCLPLPEFSSSSVSNEAAKMNDISDTTSYMSISTSSDRTASPLTYGSPITFKQKKRAGYSTLRFIRQYPFAQQAIYCLLSGRTLVVLGADESTVRKLVNALIIFVPNLGKYGETVQPWLSSSFQLTDLQRWKLIGLQRYV